MHRRANGSTHAVRAGSISIRTAISSMVRCATVPAERPDLTVRWFQLGASPAAHRRIQRTRAYSIRVGTQVNGLTHAWKAPVHPTIARRSGAPPRYSESVGIHHWCAAISRATSTSTTGARRPPLAGSAVAATRDARSRTLARPRARGFSIPLQPFAKARPTLGSQNTTAAS
jgi:hypothetical protein